jgi:hypothetical protein
MKKIIAFSLGCSIAFLCVGQNKKSAVILHAYYRESTPGILPRNNLSETENDRQENTRAQKIRSWIFFAEYAPNFSVQITSLQIEGKSYPCRITPVTEDRVVFQRPGIGYNLENDTLVPPTKNKIVRINAEQLILEPDPKKLPSVRIRYTYNGRTRSSAPIRVKTLPPLILQ